MDYDVARAFCSLCGEDRFIDEVIPLNNCPCVFCRGCLTTYFTDRLQELKASQTKDAFFSTFRVHRQGQYVDDEGTTQQATILEARYETNLEEARVTLFLNDEDIVQSPYWRLTLDADNYERPCPQITCLDCPSEGCYGVITKSDAWEMFPEVYGQFMDEATVMTAQLEGCIRCPYPNCHCLIERIQVQDGQSNLTEKEHGEHYRFRCARCGKDFCGICMARPYHTDMNCRQFKMPDCRYCDKKLDPTESSPLEAMEVDQLTMRQLKQLIREAEADASWCLEKRDYQLVVNLVKGVCQEASCRASLKGSCTKRLPCGHPCIGVRNAEGVAGYRHRCLPCFDPDCPQSGSEFDGCQICWESFAKQPCIQLPCKHLIHLECAKERVLQGFPGPSISFNHLGCSMCGASSGGGPAVQVATVNCALDHPLLKKEIQPVLKLREAVNALAMRRLVDTGENSTPEVQPGGAYEGRPIDFALKRYMYYLCSKCKKPYFGGLRDCQAAANQNESFDPNELVCGGCCAEAAGQNCPRHGTSYIEWKCKYCCDVACWFCWGTTHMCEPCHSSSRRPNKPCRGAECPLKIQHSPPGSEFCLGCSLCRHRFE